MQYWLGSIVIMLLMLWGLQRFMKANPRAMAHGITRAAGVATFLVGLYLAIRGSFGAALVFWGLTYGLAQYVGRSRLSGRGAGQGRPVSRVVTDHLEMELDLDTGAMRGRVLKGVFTGRTIEALAPAELALLWRDCRFADPKSAQLIEAWLDRTHPTWRDDMARAEASPGAGGIMTETEALDILGLKSGASAEEIRKAHRDLMKRVHPDAGGSDYLASKINEAKDLLLGGGR